MVDVVVSNSLFQRKWCHWCIGSAWCHAIASVPFIMFCQIFWISIGLCSALSPLYSHSIPVHAARTNFKHNTFRNSFSKCYTVPLHMHCYFALNNTELSTGSLFLDRPDPTRRNVDPTRSDPRVLIKSLTRLEPDPTHSLLFHEFNILKSIYYYFLVPELVWIFEYYIFWIFEYYILHSDGLFFYDIWFI